MISFLLFSCGGNSIENDAKKVAELQCRAQELASEAASGDQSVLEESQKIASEAAELAKEMQGKYNSDEDGKKYLEVLNEELKNCK